MDYKKAIEIIKYASAFNSENSRLTKALDIAISAMQELLMYKQLGTLEEVREAVERQQALEPSPMLGIYGKIYECKECGNELEMYSKYCPFCGQKQKWGDEE